MIVKSIRQLAPLIGKSHTMLNRDLARGKFTQEPGGGYDVEKVRAALTRNTDMAQPSQAKGISKPKEQEAPESPSGANSYDLFNRARAVKEMAIAKERQLDLKKRQEELLEAAEVEQAWTDGLTRFKSRLLLVPDKLAAKVAACGDVLECRELIDQEIRASLQTLSETETNAA
jgi:hypothetical protein